MRVLVACEYSARVRNGFIYKGHDAISCDLLDEECPSPDGEPRHHKGDVRALLGLDFDLMIAHPPCTYLANSGVRWLYTEEGRWDKMLEAAEFFNLILNCGIPRICVENPLPHGHAPIPPYDHTVQPYHFGHGETKLTCFWLKNLPKLVPTNYTLGREAKVHREPPGPDRWKNRSRTYFGIARAMADQWG